MWKSYVEEERCVSWLRTEPSDAVYVRGEERRSAVTLGGSEGELLWGGNPGRSIRVDSTYHAQCEYRGGLSHVRVVPRLSQTCHYAVDGVVVPSV